MKKGFDIVIHFYIPHFRISPQLFFPLSPLAHSLAAGFPSAARALDEEGLFFFSVFGAT